MIKITIDNKIIAAKEGQSVLSAALEAGVYIPHLCHHPSLPDIGECKLCIVEIEGRDGIHTSCTTPAEDGMVSRTRSERIDSLRKLSMELMLAGHPSECTACPKYGQCEFQSLIQYIGVSDTRLRKVPSNNLYTEENPLFVRDLGRCVLCGRCVRACEDVRGVGVLGFKTRDGRTEISIRNGGLLADGDCRFCGACVEVCPTGALHDKNELLRSYGTKESALVPCRSKCPAHTDVPRYVAYVREGDFSEALAVIREKAPFPHTLSLVCMRFCEDACRRGCVNEAISIRDIKRIAAENGTDLWKSRAKSSPSTGRKVSVIGSGPAGLTAAYYLARKGHTVDVYEKLPKAGGMLRYGIPGYRLPEEVFESEIEDILQAGVRLHVNSPKTPQELLNEGTDAVLVAVGAHKGIRLPIEGNDLPNTYTAVEYLRNAALGSITGLGDSVLILGGGNVAFDVAGVAHRNGIKRIMMACLEPRDAMTAGKEEIEEGLGYGLELYNGKTFLRVVQNEEGKLSVLCRDVAELSVDDSGRMNIVPVPDSDQWLTADSVIFAVGQKPELEGFELEQNRGLLVVNGHRSSVEKVFACGDSVTGTLSIIHAIASGREAASAIDLYLGGDGDISEQLAKQESTSPWLGRTPGFAYKERIGCLTCDNAADEADRCLRCHLRLQIEQPKLWNAFSESQVKDNAM